jgi:aminopeptidase N
MKTEQDNIREKSLEWFFSKSEVERLALKEEYLKDEFILFDSKFGYHYTFGHIEQMYLKEIKKQGDFME